MKIYGYAHDLHRPDGMGSDDDGDPVAQPQEADVPWPWPANPGVMLPHGTMLRRAVAAFNAAGITNILTHSLPPHPVSDLGRFMAGRCFAGISNDLHNPQGLSPRLRAAWDAYHPNLLCGCDNQVFACDGSYEGAIQEALAANHVVTGSSLCQLIPYIMAEGLQPDGSSVIPHPILSGLDELVSSLPFNGRALDIWNPKILDVLEYAHAALFGPGRNIGGLWLSLGGPMLWGENDRAKQGNFYPIRTLAAREALGVDADIDMRLHGVDVAPIIARRLAALAESLVGRLKTLCPDFYFHLYPTPPETARPEPMASATVGVMQALCERLNGMEGVKIHVVVSTASNQIGMERAAHVHALIRRFPKIEFIAGVGWAPRLGISGAARLSEGYNALEVGVRERRDWHKLPTTMRRLRHVVSLL